METLKFLALFLHPAKNRAENVYTLLSSKNHLTKETLYLNLGYWPKTGDYDEACRDLAKLLAEEAGLSAKDELLDVGFGYGDQDFYWMEAFSPKRIVGINITAAQVDFAKKRVLELGFKDRIEFRVGSATQLPFEDASFDVITSLESAFHYDTREDFFREAFRVLRPGGRLATADLVPMPGRRGPLQSIPEYFSRSFWQIPAVNQYDRHEYEKRLAAAGFGEIRISSIREQVFAPFARFARSRLREDEVARRMNPWVRAFWGVSVLSDSAWDQQDYIIAAARKPG